MKKFILIIMLFPILIPAQKLKAVGGKIGFTFIHSTWDLSDPEINKFYPEKPKFYNAFLGLYGEFFSNKSLSTCVDLSYHYTDYQFDYSMKDKYGEVIGTSSIRNSIQYISLLIKEKLKYGKGLGPNVYGFLGPRLELEFHKNYDKDFVTVFNNTNKVLLGYTVGAGFSYNFTTVQALAECYWHGDIIKTYSSDYGKILNNGLGINIGAGWYVAQK